MLQFDAEAVKFGQILGMKEDLVRSTGDWGKGIIFGKLFAVKANVFEVVIRRTKIEDVSEGDSSHTHPRLPMEMPFGSAIGLAVRVEELGNTLVLKRP